MGATNSWKSQDNFVDQTVLYLLLKTWKLAHWKLLCTLMHIYTCSTSTTYTWYMRKENVSFISSGVPSTTVATLTWIRRTWAARGTSRAPFRIQLQFALSEQGRSRPLARRDLLAVVDSSNLPSAVVRSNSLVRFNGRSGGENEIALTTVRGKNSNQTRSPTTRFFVHVQLHWETG